MTLAPDTILQLSLTVIGGLLNLLIALVVFTIRGQIKAVKELLTQRLDEHEKRLDKAGA